MLGHLGSRHRKGRETAMPELPEVETVCRTLFERLLGTRIAKVRVIDGRLRQPVAADFATNLRGGIVVAISRRGNFILVKLDSGYSLVSHLGMSGKLTFREGAASVEKHDHIVFTLGDGSELRYHDPRRFGLCVVLLSRDLDAWPPFARLGMDPLDHGFNGSYQMLNANLSVLTVTCCWISRLSADSATFTSMKCCFASEFVLLADVAVFLGF